MKRVFLVLGIIAALLVSAALAADWAVVDVEQYGEGGHRFVIPAPLALVQFGLRFADEKDLEIDCELEPETLELAHAALRELEWASDAELVRVEDGDETVRIFIEAGVLRVQVEEPGEQVEVRVHVESLRRALERIPTDRPLQVADLLKAARRQPSGHIVHVKNHEERVDVWLW